MFQKPIKRYFSLCGKEYCNQIANYKQEQFFFQKKTFVNLMDIQLVKKEISFQEKKRRSQTQLASGKWRVLNYEAKWRKNLCN